MEDLTLRTGWKNELLDRVQKAGLSPPDFQWEEEPSDQPNYNYKVSILRHSTSKFYFKFDRRRTGGFTVKFSPAKYQLEATKGGIRDWPQVVVWFDNWLTYLQEETAPDLWQQLQEYSPNESLVDTERISNTPFTYLEVERILSDLDRIEREIESSFSLQEQELAFVKRQIEYLKDGAKRQGRKDWFHTSIGVIATIAMGLALAPEKTKFLWELFKSCVAGLLQLPAP